MKNKVENFEAYLNEMQQIVEKLEQDNLSLDESMQLFETGTQVYRKATTMLDEAKSNIDILLEDGELQSLDMINTDRVDQQEGEEEIE